MKVSSARFGSITPRQIRCGGQCTAQMDARVPLDRLCPSGPRWSTSKLRAMRRTRAPQKVSGRWRQAERGTRQHLARAPGSPGSAGDARAARPKMVRTPPVRINLARLRQGAGHRHGRPCSAGPDRPDCLESLLDCRAAGAFAPPSARPSIQRDLGALALEYTCPGRCAKTPILPPSGAQTVDALRFLINHLSFLLI